VAIAYEEALGHPLVPVLVAPVPVLVPVPVVAPVPVLVPVPVPVVAPVPVPVLVPVPVVAPVPVPVLVLVPNSRENSAAKKLFTCPITPPPVVVAGATGGGVTRAARATMGAPVSGLAWAATPLPMSKVKAKTVVTAIRLVMNVLLSVPYRCWWLGG
jgi:hypothetical protein